MNFRIETDSMGEVHVPVHAYFGAQTQRAKENFTIGDIRFPPLFLHSIALVKKFAAQVNAEQGLLDTEFARVIVTASDEVLAGRFADQFPVDVFQTGSGTSTNMNMNEVIACRANEMLTGKIQSRRPVHPNDHVNRCQSSNDVIPTAIHIAASTRIKNRLLPSLRHLRKTLDEKSAELMPVRKIARTHLQDAVIMKLGEEFSGYARQAALALERIAGVETRLHQLALGGTAVGTGLNAPAKFAETVIARIAEETGIGFSETPNHFEAQATCDTAVETSGILKSVATGLIKTANDIRWLASGPRCGLGEINIPPLQPGSSIMPGKVNPVIPEAVIQASTQVIANDTAVTLAGQGGFFELNTMLPLVAYNLLRSIELLSNSAERLADKCISGITANRERCEKTVKESLAVVTSLVPYTGYDRAADIARQAYRQGRSIEDVAMEADVLPREELLAVLYGDSR